MTEEPIGKGEYGDLSEQEDPPLVLGVRTGLRKPQNLVVVQVKKN